MDLFEASTYIIVKIYLKKFFKQTIYVKLVEWKKISFLSRNCLKIYRHKEITHG